MPNWKAWRRRALDVLRTWGLLAGLGLAPLPLALVAAATGFFASVPPVVLGALLAVSLGWALVATWVALEYRRRVNRVRRALSDDPQPSQWLPNGDPRLLALSDRDLEDAFVRVQRYAQDELGDDSEVWVDFLGILPNVELHFEASSMTAHKTMTVVIEGPKVGQARVELVRGGHSQQPLPPDPFTADPSWRELLRKSWLREGPRFKGYLNLRPQPNRDAFGMEDEGDVPSWYWLITYSPAPPAPTMAAPPASSYRLREGNLTKV
jgi:hypothetical protein